MIDLKQLTGLANNLEHGACFDAADCIRAAVAEIADLKSANRLLHGLVSNRDAEIERLRAALTITRNALKAVADDEDTPPEIIVGCRAALRRTLDPIAVEQSAPAKCEECGTNYADPPSKLCPGCEAYREHQR